MHKKRTPTRQIVSLLVTLVVTSGPSVHIANASGVEKAERALAPPLPKPDGETRRRIREKRANMPLRFESADGRDAGGPDFMARGDGYAVALAGSNARVAIGRTDERGPVILDIKLATEPVVGRGRNLQQGVTNYLIGNDARQWRTGVTGYAQVEYHNVFRGVDVVYYGNRQRQLEYDFVVAPGANYREISIAFDGITAARIAHDGCRSPKLDPTETSKKSGGGIGLSEEDGLERKVELGTVRSQIHQKLISLRARQRQVVRGRVGRRVDD